MTGLSDADGRRGPGRPEDTDRRLRAAETRLRRIERVVAGADSLLRCGASGLDDTAAGPHHVAQTATILNFPAAPAGAEPK
ncbi:hypothetical protein EKE94_14640 [Mesobaculum littorinae]|uniref:Uncharacterized protein n=1 Tax=Mesobaculum littorinae TaxID=2486419 RepID=A0A438AEX3_9RHOB|nr:hypothetical protein [Mesobaculum littorinae]RVV97250.1 hypothetical protein EKE94_14640 [Mesobaculum littorinae]